MRLKGSALSVTVLHDGQKAFNHNRNTHFNEKFELLFEFFLASLRSFLGTLKHDVAKRILH